MPPVTRKFATEPPRVTKEEIAYIKAGGALTDSDVLAIMVSPVNDSPVAVADAYAALAGNTLTINAASGVLVNDLA